MFKNFERQETPDYPEANYDEYTIELLRFNLVMQPIFPIIEGEEGIPSEYEQTIHNHNATMIATTEHGVYIGHRATDKAVRKAYEESKKHGVLEPLFERVPHAINTNDSSLVYIPHQMSEVRGVYFAKVAAALLSSETDKSENYDYCQLLGVQLLFDHEFTYKDNLKHVAMSIKKNEAIEAEISLLDRIIGDKNSSELSQLEMESLEAIVASAKQAHSSLKQYVIESNVEVVENEIEERKTSLKPKRVLRRIAAAASLVVAATAAVIIVPQVTNEEVSKDVDRSISEMIEQVDAELVLQNKVEPGVEIEQTILDTLDEYDQKINQLQVTGLTDKDAQIIEDASAINALFRDYIDATNDGRLEEAMDISDNLDISLIDLKYQLASPEKIPLLIALGGASFAYSMISASLIASASRKGGRRDRLHEEIPRAKGGDISYFIIQSQWDRLARSYIRANI